jgi:glutamate--cysteine ligase
MLSETDDDNRLLSSKSELLEVFQAAEKPARSFRIGMEAEKFGVHVESGKPLTYAGEFAVVRVFEWLEARGWQSEREAHGGPVIALRQAQRSITLEPGSQLELSGAPLEDLHAVRQEFDAHLSELRPLERELGLVWLGVGFHPLARQAELDWVPKQRYAIMREYLPKLGPAAHDMMRRAATVQVNLDFSSETDALRKLVVCLKLSPVVHALAANAPFLERRVSGKQSLRGEVWLNMDSSRSGLIERVLRARSPSYVDYVEWALDSGMFLIKRGGDKLANTGQTFRDFLEHGFQGERARVGDWKLHLNTLFPEARLKNTLEARCSDAQSQRLSVALPALWVGLLYDETALARAEDLAREIDLDELLRARQGLVTLGLEATIGAKSLRGLAERVLELAADGLDRRKRLDASGNSERVELEPLIALVSRGTTPADVLLQGISGAGPLSVSELVRLTRIDGPTVA